MVGPRRPVKCARRLSLGSVAKCVAVIKSGSNGLEIDLSDRVIRTRKLKDTKGATTGEYKVSDAHVHSPPYHLTISPSSGPRFRSEPPFSQHVPGFRKQ